MHLTQVINELIDLVRAIKLDIDNYINNII
jgi:hypothetical protein